MSSKVGGGGQQDVSSCRPTVVAVETAIFIILHNGDCLSQTTTRSERVDADEGDDSDEDDDNDGDDVHRQNNRNGGVVTRDHWPLMSSRPGPRTS